MEFVEAVAALALLDLPFFKFASKFCELAEKMTLADSVIIEMFRVGATYHCPVDLPDTAGLCWREAILRCLGSVRAQAGAHSSAAVTCRIFKDRNSRDPRIPTAVRGQGKPAKKCSYPADRECGHPADRECGHPADRECGHPADRECGHPADRVCSKPPNPPRPPETPGRLKCSCISVLLRHPGRPPPLPVGTVTARDAPTGRGRYCYMSACL
ncbi:uncharacterized protein LOC131552720 [Onychostoma macrolepis]|uniref:uncharacterized protein LOC131552720 n=1 Tax=Onychostoma macrolepis TaxID=369639 RepID=UPI00272CF432|nr:uncharacterized protein LOC131552720 [Onychostoma macrolepis]